MRVRLRVDPHLIGRAAGQLAAALDVAVQLRVGGSLEAVAAAVPGGVAASVVPEVASEWRRREVDLSRALGSDADLLRAAAQSYRHVEGGTVSALGRLG